MKSDDKHDKIDRSGNILDWMRLTALEAGALLEVDLEHLWVPTPVRGRVATRDTDLLYYL